MTSPIEGKGAIPIQETQFWEYFDDIADVVAVGVLSCEDANRLWRDRVDARGRSFFKLPDDSWVASGRKSPIGLWQPSLNNGDSESFRAELNAKVYWVDDSKVLFFANPATALTCDWLEFKKHWIAFLLLEADASMVLPAEHISQCVLFTALGRSEFIEARPTGVAT